MKLYAHVRRKSPNAFKLQVALEEANASYEYVAVDLSAGEQRTSAFLTLNPHGKIPVLVDGDFVLAESGAILWYIADTFPGAGLLPPPGDVTVEARQQRARILQWSDFAFTAVYPAYYDVYLHTASLAPDKRNPLIAESATQKYVRAVGVMEMVFSARAYLAGSYSIADIALAAVIQVAKDRVPGDPANRPAINDWLDRVTSRPAWTKAVAAAG